MREQETVKGVARRVVIVRSPAESVFEEAIFIVREEAERSGGVSREEVLSEARRAEPMSARYRPLAAASAGRPGPSSAPAPPPSSLPWS